MFEWIERRNLISISISTLRGKKKMCFVGKHSMVFRHLDLPEIGAKRGLELGLSVGA